MKWRVTGLASPPSIFWMRPFSTVTSMVQASGQSSGQAVRTVECPHRSPETGRMRPIIDGLFDIGAVAAVAHVDAGRPPAAAVRAGRRGRHLVRALAHPAV